MKFFAFLLLGSTLAMSSAFAAPAPENKANTAPILASEFKLEAYQGQFVYLDFWASWCGPCRQSFPFMNDLVKQYGAQNLTVIAINVDEESDDARDFLKKYPANFKVVLDAKGELAKKYPIKGMPTSFLLDKNGKVLFTHSGFRTKDVNKLTTQIQSYLKK